MSEPLSFTIPDELVDRVAQRVVEILAEQQPKRDDGYLDAAAAAKYLSTTTGRIYDLVQLNKLPPMRDGRRLLFRRGDLDGYLEASS